jgi:predicted Fe-S protein YdhL (DUF1289 family)
MKSSASNDSVLSPCVRNCCLDENDICMGCYRSLDEILRWSGASVDEKREILAVCRARHERHEQKKNATF